MNRDTLIRIADALLAAATEAVPGAAPTVAMVKAGMDAVIELSDQLHAVRDNEPGVWAQVEQDYAESTDAFRASVARHA